MPPPVVQYVYGVVTSGTPLASMPFGIDDARIESVSNGSLAALVSALDADSYAPARVGELTADRDWLMPRARAHHSVITAASDLGAVIPFPMWVMFSDRDAVSAMLDERRVELEHTLESVRGAREYVVRIVCDVSILEPVVATLAPELAALETQMRTASPGQSYLLGRKLAAARKDALRDVARRIAGETHERLAHDARVTAPVGQGSHASVILHEAYLVEDGRYDAFRTTLTDLVSRYASSGFTFDFTGPWPPFHVARAD